METGALEPGEIKDHGKHSVAPRPKIGSAVTIVSTTGGEPTYGVLTLWSASDRGQVILSRVSTSEPKVRALIGQRVWVSAAIDDVNGRVFYQATGRIADGHPDEVELTSVTRMMTERHRGALRAYIAHPIQLVDQAGMARATSTVDLSSSGARVRLPQGPVPEVGTKMTASITIGPGEPVRANAHVVRVDLDRQQAALAFTILRADDMARLNRDVMAWLDECVLV